MADLRAGLTTDSYDLTIRVVNDQDLQILVNDVAVAAVHSDNGHAILQVLPLPQGVTAIVPRNGHIPVWGVAGELVDP